mgnify:CR=1 FL=1
MSAGSAPSRSRLLDGQEVARGVHAEIRDELRTRWGSGRRPGLAIVVLTSDAASRRYAERKVKACAELGMACTLHDLAGYPPDLAVIGRRIADIAADPAVHGVMVEQPLPPTIDSVQLYAFIPPEKDVEGISCANMGRLLLGQPHLVACTAAAVMRILEHYKIAVAGKRAVVVGRSHIVGKPLALLLLARDATVVVCHSATPDLVAETARADVLVAAAGRPRLIGASHVREGAVVVDVGTNFENGRMLGDVDFDEVSPRAAAITPVPGGVGPVTTALLLSNLLVAARRQQQG